VRYEDEEQGEELVSSAKEEATDPLLDTEEEQQGDEQELGSSAEEEAADALLNTDDEEQGDEQQVEEYDSSVCVQSCRTTGAAKTAQAEKDEGKYHGCVFD
jgi:hypothetical protein